jgi:hypothetical protein
MDYETVNSPSYPTPNWSQFGDTIGDLANTFRSGQQQNQQRDISTAFKDGIPTDPATGQPDYNKIMQILAQKGDINAIGQYGPMAQQQQQVPLSPLLGGGPGTPAGAAPAAAAPVPAVPRVAAPQAAPQAPVTNVPAPGGAQLGDLSGASAAFPSVNSMVFSSLPDDWTGGVEKMQTIASNVAKAVKADPTAPMTQDQAAQAQRILSAYMQRNGIAPKSDSGEYADTQSGHESFIRAYAKSKGLDPDVVAKIAASEGLKALSPKNPNSASAVDVGADGKPFSFGDFQDNVRNGLGTEMRKAGLDPADPGQWQNVDKANIDYMADNDLAPWRGDAEVKALAQQAPGGGNLPPASAAAGIPTRPASNQAADNSAQPIGPQVPLPPGFKDPQQAILAIDKEMARLSVNPRAAGQVAALQDWRDRIEKSSALMEVRPGETLLDPRTGKVAFQSTPANASNLALQRFLEENPDASAQQIQAFVQSGRSSRSAASAYINRYLQENPNATAEDVAKAAQDYTKESSAITKFTSGAQGNTIRSFNVLVDHLGVLNDAVAALKNGDVRLFNQAAQAIAVQTGQPAPTNFDSVKSIVGDELVKAIVGGVATIGDREEVKKNIDKAESPEQLAGAIEQYRRLSIGQLHGLEKQYQESTGRDDFDSLLFPGTLEYFKAPDKKADTSAGKDAAPGKPDKDGWVTLPGGIRIREAQ